MACSGTALLYIKMELKDIGYKDVDWMQVAQDRICWWVLLDTVMNFRVQETVESFWAS
jgi:hypothetical protein